VARYLARRSLRVLGTFFGLTWAAFLLVRLMPVDLCTSQLGFAAANRSLYEQCRIQNQLDQPIPVQYLTWLGRFARGDLGTDRATGQPMLEFLARKLVTSLELLALSLPVSVALGTALGLYLASKAGSRTDGVLSTATMALVSAPAIIVGSALPFLFAVKLRWLPVQGLPPLGRYPLRHLESLIMPVLVLILSQIPLFTRVVRAEAITVLQSDFVAAARGKGLRNRLILRRHVLRPSSIPLATVTATYIGEAVSALIVVERLFRLDGFGSAFVGAITARSTFLMMTLVTMGAAIWMVVSALLEVVYVKLDPRLARS
jgi:peptide/nickel transport system permease protein